MKRKIENNTVLPPAKKQRTYQELNSEPNKIGKDWYQMGLYCEAGTSGVKQDRALAFRHYSVAYQKDGYQPAAFKLALYHQMGVGGIRVDLESAFKYFKELGTVNYVEAYLPLALCYYNPQGTVKDLDLAFKYFSMAADNKNSVGMYWKGSCLMKGQGVKQNMALSFKCFEEAFNLGLLEAAWELGEFYKRGEGVRANPGLAFHYYNISAARENLLAMFELGLCYLKGRGTEKNAELAIKYLQACANKGYAPAQYQLGKYYWKKEQNIGQAYMRIKQAVDQEHPAALCWMGLYQHDEKKAFPYFQKAAEMGHIKSQYQLGRCYELGLGVEIDLVKAFESYKKAASRNSDAMYQLGHCYKNGHGVDINLELSIEWYQKAAKLKPEANKELYEFGLRFLNGEGVKPDFATAYPILGAVIKAGFIEAQFHLALYYENVAKNEAMAFKGYEEYARLKYIEHCTFEFKGDDLGELFCEVAKIACKEKNKLITSKYLEQASQLGNSEAQYRLGDFCSGIYFSYSDSLNFFAAEIDIFKSVEQYKKSANQGNPVAKSRLENMEVQFNKGLFIEMVEKNLAKAEAQYIWVIERLEPGCLLTKTNYYLDRLRAKIKKQDPVLCSSVPVNYADMDLNSLIKIADDGVCEAQYSLARYYQLEANKHVNSASITFFPGINGSDLVRVYSAKAEKYFQLAASQGHEKAKTELETMNPTAKNIFR